MSARSEDELAELRAAFPGASSASEGGITYFLLPKLALPPGCVPDVLDALLCPTARDGYVTRLFFAQRIERPPRANWNTFHILDRTWHAPSWQGVAANLRLVQIVAGHLRAFR